MKHCNTCGCELVPRQGEGPKKWASRKFCSVKCSWGPKTEHLDDVVVDAYLKGVKTTDILTEYHLGRTTLYKILERHNVKHRKPGCRIADLPPADEVAARIRLGESFTSVSNDLHRRDTVLRDHLIEAGYDHLTGVRFGEERPKVHYKASDTGSMHYIGGTGHWGGLPMREAS